MDKRTVTCPFLQNELCQAYPDGKIAPTAVEKTRYCQSGKFLHCYILGGLNYPSHAESPVTMECERQESAVIY